MKTESINTLINRRRLFFELCKSTIVKTKNKTTSTKKILKAQPVKDEFVPAKREQHIIDAIREQLD